MEIPPDLKDCDEAGDNVDDKDTFVDVNDIIPEDKTSNVKEPLLIQRIPSNLKVKKEPLPIKMTKNVHLDKFYWITEICQQA